MTTVVDPILFYFEEVITMSNEKENLIRPTSDIEKNIYDQYSIPLNQLSEDPTFQKAFEALDTDKFSELFQDFQEYARHYNAFHRTERRLWSVKIGKGRIDRIKENDFRKSISAGRQNYIDAFDSINEIHSLLDKSGFSPIIDKHLPNFTSSFDNPNDPITKAVKSFALDIGCSKSMIDEFFTANKGYDLLKVAGGFEGLAVASALLHKSPRCSG